MELEAEAGAQPPEDPLGIRHQLFVLHVDLTVLGHFLEERQNVVMGNPPNEFAGL